jgi:predicted transcriptional regulator
MGYAVARAYRRTILPDDHAGSSHVSLRVPDQVVEAYDKLATILDRPRSWVMLRALRQYLEDEGAEIVEDVESLAELDRGESAPFEDSIRVAREIVSGSRKQPVRRR